MPFRDEAPTIAECVESIRAQTLTDFELVAVNDGSEDGSDAIVRQFAVRDPRIHLLDPGKIGLVKALNLGVTESRAPLIARMDADDVMHPERLQAQDEFMREHPEITVAGCQVEPFPGHEIRAGYREYIRWQNECVTPDEIANNRYVESPLAHPSVMFRRDAFLRLGGYTDGPLPEDYELWLRMAANGCLMGKVPRKLLQWRERANRLSRIDPRYSREAFDQLRATYLAKDPRITDAHEIVVWGAGRKTRQRFRLLQHFGVEPSAWIDIDPRKIGKTFSGKKVHSPDWLNREPRPFVLVYVTNHGARDLIAERLKLMGYGCGADYLCVG